MRAEDEIRRAHDLLVAVLLGEIPNPWTGAPQEILIGAADVLCWVLQHEHNRTFEKNLAEARAQLAQLGIVERKVQ
jgi:hypothetical protein